MISRTVPTTLPQWLRAAGWQTATQIYLSLWYFGLAIVIVPTLLFLISRRFEIEMSAMQYAQQAAVWIPFSVSVVIVLTLLTSHVANGMTRRSFVRGAILAALGTGVVYAAGATALLAAERAVYDRLGWRHGGTDTESPRLAIAGSLLGHFGGLLLLVCAATLTGLLVAAVYYRVGGRWGTLALPLTLAPLATTGLLALDPTRSFTPWGVTVRTDGWDFALEPYLTPLVGVVAIAAAAVALHLVVRDTPIARKEG